MKLRTNTPIPHPINLQLEHQPRTLTSHIQRKIQVIKLHPLRRRQSREQALRHRVQVRGQCADIDKTLLKGVGRRVRVAGYEVVFYDEGLAGPEVARVVERYGSVF